MLDLSLQFFYHQRWVVAAKFFKLFAIKVIMRCIINGQRRRFHWLLWLLLRRWFSQETYYTICSLSHLYVCFLLVLHLVLIVWSKCFNGDRFLLTQLRLVLFGLLLVIDHFLRVTVIQLFAHLASHRPPVHLLIGQLAALLFQELGGHLSLRVLDTFVYLLFHTNLVGVRCKQSFCLLSASHLLQLVFFLVLLCFYIISLTYLLFFLNLTQLLLCLLVYSFEVLAAPKVRLLVLLLRGFDLLGY